MRPKAVKSKSAGVMPGGLGVPSKLTGEGESRLLLPAILSCCSLEAGRIAPFVNIVRQVGAVRFYVGFQPGDQKVVPILQRKSGGPLAGGGIALLGSIRNRIPRLPGQLTESMHTPRSLAGKPLAGFCATPIRRIPVLCGTVIHVLR